MKRRCTVCGQEKEASEFHRRGVGLRRDCKRCAIIRVADYRATAPEKISSRKRLDYEANRQKYLDAARFRTTGFTPEMFEQAFARQRGLCAICGEQMARERGAKGACADHCHATSRPRALLCMMCNSALGHMKDRPDLLRKGADYLEEWDDRSRSRAA